MTVIDCMRFIQLEYSEIIITIDRTIE